MSQGLSHAQHRCWGDRGLWMFPLILRVLMGALVLPFIIPSQDCQGMGLGALVFSTRLRPLMIQEYPENLQVDHLVGEGPVIRTSRSWKEPDKDKEGTLVVSAYLYGML